MSLALPAAPRLPRHSSLAWLGALLAWGLALAARWALEPLLPPVGFPFLTFFPAVMLATLFCGLGPGLACAGLSMLAAKWFFMPEPGSLHLRGAADAVALAFFGAVLLVDCLAIHLLSRALHAVRAERARAAAAAGHNSALAGELARVLEATSDGVFAVDSDWRITFLNGRAATLLGCGTDRRGQVLAEVFPEGVDSPFCRACRATMADRQSRKAEALYAPLGRHFQAESHARADGGIVLFFRDLTEQRAAASRLADSEATLAASEARLRLAGEAANVGFFECDLVAGTTHWSAAMFRIYGLDPARGAPSMQFEGEHLALVHPEERERLYQLRRRLSADPAETQLVADFRIHRGDTGAVRWIASRGEFVRNAAGEVVLVRGAQQDVTERYLAEQALAESEARLRTIVETVPVGLVMAELPSGRIVGGNSHVARMLRHPVLFSPDVDGYDEWVAFHADGTRVRGHEYPLARMALHGEEAPEIEVNYRRGDGTLAWTRIMGRAVRNERGEMVGGVVALVDVDSERRAAEAMAASEARFRALAESIPSLLFETDAEGANIYVNPRYVDYTGRPLESLTGWGWVEVLHPEDRARAADDWAAAVRAGVPHSGEYRFRRHDGAWRWFLCRGVPVHDAHGRLQRWVGTCTDTTDAVAAREVLAREAEQLDRLAEERARALAESETRLAHAAKMEALGRLAGGIAHDFNNVLQAVRGGLSLASRRLGEEPEQARRYLALASEAAGRGAAVTGRLLSFARRGELQSEPVAAQPLLLGLAEFLRPAVGPNIKLDVAAAADLPLLLADRGQLESVLANLANNARDAMPGGGRMLLRAAAAAVPGALRAPPGLAPGDYVRLSVEDEGEGMPPEVLARVAEPFFTTKPKGQGTGLGLAMARGFAEQSGGALAIESTPGAGTTVHLWLPCAPMAAPPPPLADLFGPCASEPCAQGRLLLVEDKAEVRAVLAAELADSGFTVTEAEDAQAGLDLLDHGLKPDALVTDLAMPGVLDGLDLVREARSRLPRLPAVLVTGHAGEAGPGRLEEAERSGPFALLRKPVATPDLMQRLGRVLQHGRAAAAG